MSLVSEIHSQRSEGEAEWEEGKKISNMIKLTVEPIYSWIATMQLITINAINRD